MSLSIGIVGLPNVGKSTLFNALTNLGIVAENYPFATIEPNVGIVAVPDTRLDSLAKLENSTNIIPTVIEFKDIAGLVAGAHKGEGLGNQFLHHIREVDAIIEVVRFFDDKKVTHVSGEVDPKRDIETIETELLLADLQMLEKKVEVSRKGAKSRQKDDLLRLEIAEKYLTALSQGRPGREVELAEEGLRFQHEFPLLTNKPILYVANTSSAVPNNNFEGRDFVALDIKLESELSGLSTVERNQYTKDLGLKMSGLDKLILKSYTLLNLITFFTAGPKETRAWTCKRATKAPAAAGIIHSDFEKGFIKAEVINWQILLDCGSYARARELGKLRQEGRQYAINDGDVVLFRFNV